MPLPVAIAIGVLLALAVLRLFVSVVDWLDARTSRITEAEARRRAKLALIGQWPPAVRPLSLSPRVWVLVFMALALLWGLSRLLTPPLQSRL